MSRLLIASAALAMATTTAVAAPGFGSMNSSSQGAARAERADVSLLSLVASFFSIEFTVAEAGAPVRDRQRPSRPVEKCEQAEAASEKENAGADHASNRRGPDPMLLAF